MENTQDQKKININVQERDHDIPHIAILPCPGMGHLIPHLELAKRLCNYHGIQVTFFVYLTEASAAQSQYLIAHPLPESLHVYHLPPRDISTFVTDFTDIQTRICIIIRESLPDVESYIVNSHHKEHTGISNTGVSPVNVLIADFFATDSFDIADKIGIPKYIFFCPAADLLLFIIYFPILDSQVQGEFVDLKEPIKIPGCKPLQPRDLVDPVRNRKTDAYNWFLHHASRFQLADGVLINTSQDLEPKTIKALREDPALRQLGTPRIYPVGPLIKPSSAKVMKDEDSYITARINQQPEDSVIFVSFGSGGTLSAEQTTESAWGLELSRKRFIWVVRKPVEADASAAFFSVGNEENNPNEYLPHEYQNRINGVGLLVTTWAPQTELLGHSSVEVETTEHLFILCPVIMELWQYFMSSLKVCWEMPFQFNSLMLGWRLGGVNARVRMVWQLLPFAICWEVWNERNRRVHGGRAKTNYELQIAIKQWIHLRSSNTDIFKHYSASQILHQ
ncbi:hydroquinone glucosyltransferase-like [Papaver somniferum]|uniref:hydroquinone glucosyltransferase-like n=1 Tax=Papaver somniferum TaxID=3469 RepID=UPI000E6FAF1D|nr:hydroquinone glucosyltransferase-like [Papaver somniferum]